jgi:hypothetical protein
MTDVRERVVRPPAMHPSLVLHGSLVALAAALSGLATLSAIVLIAWVADARPGTDGADAVRAAADAWLLAHGGGLRLPGGWIRGLPLGLTLLAAVVLHRAGASLARAVGIRDLRTAGRATAALAVPYGLVAAAVARIAATDTVASSAAGAGFGALVLATGAGGRGIVRAANLTGALRRRLPDWLPATGRAALAAVGALLAAGAALVLVSLLVHAGRVGDLFGALRPGPVGGIVLVLGCLLLFPNAALWSVAYAAGPGFAVGAGTSVSPFGATLGPVPAFPLLAALPGDGAPAPVIRSVLLLPVLAGVLAGWMLARRLPPAAPAEAAPVDNTGWWRAALSGRAARSAAYGLAAGAGAAAVLTVLAALAGGALGPGYLAAVGPSPWRVLLALTAELAVPAALTAALHPGRATSRPAPRPGVARRAAGGSTRAVPGGPGWGAGRNGADRGGQGGGDGDETAGAGGDGRTP